jgi:hypothetical protein
LLEKKTINYKQNTWCIKVCNFVTKCCKTHLQAYSNPKNFLASLSLAMRERREEAGEGKRKGEGTREGKGEQEGGKGKTKGRARGREREREGMWSP